MKADIRIKKLVCIIISVILSIPAFTVTASSGMKAGEQCIELIKEAEGFSKYKYWDYSQWTIGYGTGVLADDYPDGITEAEAEKLLYSAVEKYEGYVNSFADKYNITLKQNQFDALVSLTYNMGNIWSAYDEFDLKSYLIDGSENHSFLEIEQGFGEWRVAGGTVNQGLVNRRQQEAGLFLSDRTDPYGEVWRVTSEDGINLRIQPDVFSEKTGFMPMNTIYYVTEKKTTGDGYLWGKTMYDGIEHWCVLDYSKYAAGGPLTISEENYSGNVTEEVWVITSDDGVKLRTGPGLNYSSICVIPENGEITVTSTAEADGYLWGKVTYGSLSGWCVLDYAKKKDSQETELPGKTLEKIYISSLPDKTSYTEGEMFDISGMTVTAVYSDGSQETISDYTTEGFESAPGTWKITVKYLEFTTTFNVTVSEKTLSGIEIESLPDKIVYTIGEALDLSGIKVNAVYSNGSKEEITDYTVSGDNSAEGTNTIEISYMGFSEYFKIRTVQKKVTDIEITKLPDKIEYTVGQTLDTSGMVVYAYYDDGSSQEIDYYTVSGYNSQIEGIQSVRVSCGEISKTFEVNVKAAEKTNLTGDINGDGIVNIFDIIILNQYVDTGKTSAGSNVYMADMDSDGTLDRIDVELLAKLIAEQ